MSNDRFKFRVWDNTENSYTTSFAFVGKVHNDGTFCAFGNTSENLIVEQCTGLRDVNGRLIYEGDIIESFDHEGEPVRHVVEWNKDFARFEAVLVPKYEWTNNCGSISKEWLTLFEKRVIGNIHENPELLETQK